MSVPKYFCHLLGSAYIPPPLPPPSQPPPWPPHQQEYHQQLAVSSRGRLRPPFLFQQPPWPPQEQLEQPPTSSSNQLPAPTWPPQHPGVSSVCQPAAVRFEPMTWDGIHNFNFIEIVVSFNSGRQLRQKWQCKK